MMTIQLKHIYNVPTSWQELTADQFVRISSIMSIFEKGEIDFNELKILLVAAVLDVDMGKLAKSEALFENFYRISEQLQFLYRVSDEDERKEIVFDVLVSKQMLPILHKSRGYRFSLDGGVVNTSLVAEQYIDAISLVGLYGKCWSADALDTLVRVLYCPGTYSKDNMTKVKVSKFTAAEKLAIYYNFRGILDWIREIGKYDLIFNTEATSGNKSPMGLEGSLYVLSKVGYGDVGSIGALPLFTYLDLLLEQTIDSIRQLNAAGLKPLDIADKLNLSLEQISTVL